MPKLTGGWIHSLILLAHLGLACSGDPRTFSAKFYALVTLLTCRIFTMTVDARPSVVSHTYGDDDIVVSRAASIRRLSVERANNATNQANAKSAFETEKTMTVRQAIRLYKKAIMFSMAMSLAVVMEG
jgi:hypothetical protein